MTSVKLKSASLNSTETFLPPTSKFKFTRVLDNFQSVNREAEDRDREGLEAAKQDTEVEKFPGRGAGGGAEQDTDHAEGGGEDQSVAGQREIHETA